MPEGVERFGRYDLLRRIARGGMAEIFLAIEHGIEDVSRYVVIKRILPQVAESQDFVAMFMDEARVASRLSHPNIAQIFQFGEVEGVYYLAMEFVEGMTLSKMIRHHQDRGLPVEIALRIASDVCAGLHHAHELLDEYARPLGVVHRDVSPQNVVVSKTGVAKLLDFGIAHASSKAHITAQGQLKGKLSYMAPEQFIGEGVDRRADVFATGVVLHEMISGKKLFHRDFEAATMRALLEDAPPSLADRAPPEVDDIVRTATAKRISDRYETAAAMESAIEELVMRRGMAVTSHGLAAFVKAQIRDAKEQTSLVYSSPGTTPATLGVVQAPRQDELAPTLALTPSGVAATGAQQPPAAVAELPVTKVTSPALGAQPSASRRAALVGAAIAFVVMLAAGLVGIAVFAARPDPADAPARPDPAPSQPAERPTDPPPAPPALAGPPRVHVTLRGVPEGATVAVDGLAAPAAGFEVAADGQAHVVEIAATGFEPWARTVSPTSDLEIEVALTAAHRRDRPPRGRPGGDPDAILVRDPGY